MSAFCSIEQMETNLHLPIAMTSSFAATNHLRLDPLTWVINQTPELRGVQHLQQVHAQTQAATASVAPTPATAPAGATVPPVVQPTELTDVHSWMLMPQVSMAQIGNHMKDRMLLDSCSSVDLFCNPNLVHNKTKTEKTLNLLEMTMTGE